MSVTINNSLSQGLPDGELVIKVGGKFITGWKDVAISRGVLRMPSDFRIMATKKLTGDINDLVPLNDPLQILIGGHVILTGYLERSTQRLEPEEHTVVLSGRGRCCDLVDCSAIIKGTTSLSGSSIGQLAQQLVAPFAGPISVVTPDGDGDGKAFTFNINLSESPYEILERVARWEGLLVYENADGNLVLSRVGTKKHASGFVSGQNIQAAETFNSRDERFSTYIPQLMSGDVMGQIGAGGNAAGLPTADPGINRYRPKIVISEQMASGTFFAQQRARWEADHRAGNSFRVELTCDSWLDSAGTPWTPNMLAMVSVPQNGIEPQDMIITEVTHVRNGRQGTISHVTLMPPGALTVEPSALNALSSRFLPDAGKGGALGQPGPGAGGAVTAPNASPDNPHEGRGYGL